MSEVNNIRSAGFTLIELLVAISIIGLLTTVAVVSLQNSRMKGRDAKRLQDITTMEKAVEMYYQDNGFYPAVNNAYTNATNCGNLWCTLETALSPYLKQLPRDPLGLQTAYYYYYDSDPGDYNKTYGLFVMLEDPGNYDLTAADGGYADSPQTHFEKGTQLAYCMNKYAGTGRMWFGNHVTVCFGGN